MSYVQNPETKRQIKVGGPTYKRLVKLGVDFEALNPGHKQKKFKVLEPPTKESIVVEEEENDEWNFDELLEDEQETEQETEQDDGTDGFEELMKEEEEPPKASEEVQRAKEEEYEPEFMETFKKLSDKEKQYILKYLGK